MNAFDRLILKEITEIYTVSAAKGKHITIENRKSCALTFCYEGKITYTHNGRKFISIPDSAVFIPKGATYTLYNNAGGLFPLINFEAEAAPNDFICIPCKKEMLSEYERLRNSFHSGASRIHNLGQLYSLFSHLTDIPSRPAGLLTPALQYIETHLSSPSLCNTDTARAADISEVYLRALFKKELGVSPHRYIVLARLQKAARLLMESRKTVGEIAADCGFASMYHFCHTFKAHYSVTPSQYRNRI